MGATKQTDYIGEAERLLYNLVVENSKEVPVETLATAVSKSASTIYRAANPNDETTFNALWLPVIMNIKEDYRLLEFFNKLCGFLPPVGEPKFEMNKKLEIKKAVEFKKGADDAVNNFFLILNEPTKENFKLLKKSIHQLLKLSLAAEYYGGKVITQQGELDI